MHNTYIHRNFYYSSYLLNDKQLLLSELLKIASLKLKKNKIICKFKSIFLLWVLSEDNQEN